MRLAALYGSGLRGPEEQVKKTKTNKKAKYEAHRAKKDCVPIHAFAAFIFNNCKLSNVVV